MLFAAQEQVLRTNAIDAKIDKQPISLKYRLCGTMEEPIMHLVSGYPKLVQYKRIHDTVARRVHWNYARRVHWEFCSDRWYEHSPAEVMENDDVKLYLDLSTQTDIDSGTKQARYYPS